MEAARVAQAEEAKAEAVKAEAEQVAQAEAARAEAARIDAAEAQAVRAAQAERVKAKPAPAGGRPRAKMVARGRGWSRPAKAAPTELVRERLSNAKDGPPPAAPPPVEAPAAAVEWRKSAKAGVERINEQLHKSGRRARPGRSGRILAAATAIAIPALAVLAAACFDPLAPEGCPAAVDRGLDCARYGAAGRLYSAMALLKVQKDLDSARWASAKAALKPILAIRPNFSDALDDRGQAEAGLGDTTAALADYDRALTLAPGDLAARAKRGELYQSLGKTGRAAADFAVVYHTDPSTPGWADVAAFVRGIDHSTPPPVVHKHPKHRRRPSADAATPAGQSPPSNPPAET
ncbi:MAG: tetratricopeptide repeat protein [Caulobacteraceae bacterium]